MHAVYSLLQTWGRTLSRTPKALRFLWMAWLCCTVVPQRECLWLRWGLLALQTSNIFSCVAWRGAVVCLLHSLPHSVFMIRRFVALQPQTHLQFSLLVYYNPELQLMGWRCHLCLILCMLVIHAGRSIYPWALLCSQFAVFSGKRIRGYDLFRCHVFISLSLSFPLCSLSVYVCVWKRETVIAILIFYYEYEMRLLRTGLLSAVCVVLLAFMWRLSRQICQYQSLCAEASEALHLLKDTLCDPYINKVKNPGSQFQSTGLEPCYYSQNSWQGFTYTDEYVIDNLRCWYNRKRSPWWWS